MRNTTGNYSGLQGIATIVILPRATIYSYWRGTALHTTLTDCPCQPHDQLAASVHVSSSWVPRGAGGPQRCLLKVELGQTDSHFTAAPQQGPAGRLRPPAPPDTLQQVEPAGPHPANPCPKLLLQSFHTTSTACNGISHLKNALFFFCAHGR